MAAVCALVLRRGELWLVTTAAVVVADTGAAVIKELTDRQRPFVPFPEPEPLLTAGGFAFPSGHAATSFAAAAVLAHALPRAAAGFVVLAAAIAWSRVYVGVHYPSDILAGALLGAAVGVSLVVAAGAARARSAAATARRRPGGDPRGSRRSRPPG